MSNKSNNISTQSALSSIAYEHLTGQKLGPNSPGLSGLHPGSNNSSCNVSSSLPTMSASNGTGHWAAGMSNADDVLGNLGIFPSEGVEVSRNSAWDHSPHTNYGNRKDAFTPSKENLPDHKARGRNTKKSGSTVYNSRSSAIDKKQGHGAGGGSSSNNFHSRGSSNLSSDATNVCHNTSTSSKLTCTGGITTSSSLRSEAIIGGGALASDALYINDNKGVSSQYSYSSSPSESQEKLYPPATDSSSLLTQFDLASGDYHSSYSMTLDGRASKEQKRRDSGVGKRSLSPNSNSTSTTQLTQAVVHNSCASSPSSNSNSLTKKSVHHLGESLDDKNFTNNSPYFNLTKNGLDQLEVLSDSGGSLSPDTITDSLADDIAAAAGSLGDSTADLDVGSMVEIVIRGMPRFGVIRWLGNIPGDKKEGRTVAGVELEDGSDGLSDGTFHGRRHFTCAPGKAIFVNLSMCHQDSRFLESLSSTASNPRASIAFGSEDCGPVQGRVAPPGGNAVLAMLGRNKGIQGHQNSCYLDATLFSMFAFTSVFDSLLFRPSTATDINEYGEVQQVLREEIVNPLRSRMFVRADRIMKLRKLLDHLSSVRGLTTEEKDPEEFLHSLLAQILKAEPYLQLSSGQEAYHYQLFLDKDDKVAMPTVQHLFDQSFLTSDIKLKQVPSILILQMPRFGKDYKMYSRILPSLLLDVTDVIEDSPRQCNICGQVAELECAQCFGQCGFGQCGSGLESIAFCSKCIHKVHTHKKRDSHTSIRRLQVPQEYRELADHCQSVPRVYMELFAVVCIETSHYVTFTRCGEGPEAPWCFFDSMADRKGEQHGYNIPSVLECGELQELVGEPGSEVVSAIPDDKALPHLTRRLLCDAYMCFYQTSKIAMYR